MQIHHHRQRPQGDELGKAWDSAAWGSILRFSDILLMSWWFRTPAVEGKVVFFPLFTVGFLYIPGGCWGISSINSIKCPLKQKNVTISRPVEVHRSFSLGPWITWATCFGVEGTNLGWCSSVSEWITCHVAFKPPPIHFLYQQWCSTSILYPIQTPATICHHCPIQNRYSETRGNNSSTASVASSSAKVVKSLVVALRGSAALCA